MLLGAWLNRRTMAKAMAAALALVQSETQLRCSSSIALPEKRISHSRQHNRSPGKSISRDALLDDS